MVHCADFLKIINQYWVPYVVYLPLLCAAHTNAVLSFIINVISILVYCKSKEKANTDAMLRFPASPSNSESKTQDDIFQ